VAYGNWSFDWHVSNNQNTYDGVEFIVTDHDERPYNGSGKVFGAGGDGKFSGYVLSLISYFTDFGPGIGLLRFNQESKPTTLDTHTFNAKLSGTHHIDIIRELNGQFKI
jgi:hypothetical protein